MLVSKVEISTQKMSIFHIYDKVYILTKLREMFDTVNLGFRLGLAYFDKKVRRSNQFEKNMPGQTFKTVL